MSLNNEVCLLGTCKDNPIYWQISDGSEIALLDVYTYDSNNGGSKKEGERLKQLHRCYFRGKLAKLIARLVTRGSKIHIRGMLCYQMPEIEMPLTQMPTILVEDFTLSKIETAAWSSQHNALDVFEENA